MANGMENVFIYFSTTLLQSTSKHFALSNGPIRFNVKLFYALL